MKIISPPAIVVVNDGSTDETEAIAKLFSVTVLSHATNLGKGAALQTGFDFVRSKPFDAVITMDADLQHQPEDIQRFLQAYSNRQDNIIIGNRLGDKKNMPFLRVLSNTLTTFLIQARTGKKILDSQSGFRFITRNVLEQVTLCARGFEAETEFLIRAAAYGFSFGAIPIETIYAGERSHMTHFSTTVNFIKVLFRQY